MSSAQRVNNKRISAVIIMLTFLYTSSDGQKRISTRQLESIADKFGVDSAIHIVQPFNYISEIDTAAALSIALRCDDLNNYSSQLLYFSEVGQSIKNETINSRAIDNIVIQRRVIYSSRNVSDKWVISDQLFHVVAFQHDVSTISILESEFAFWDNMADSIKNKYPSRIKRFFQRFKGTPPSEEMFSDCKLNSFKLAWALSKLGVAEFSNDRVDAIRQQLASYLRDYNMDTYKFKSYPTQSDTITLSKAYAAIEEIDFDSEIEFIRLKENLEGDNCWEQIITNDTLGLYEIGCQWAPLAGRGKTIRLELIDQRRLKVTIIKSWIS